MTNFDNDDFGGTTTESNGLEEIGLYYGVIINLNC